MISWCTKMKMSHFIAWLPSLPPEPTTQPQGICCSWLLTSFRSLPTKTRSTQECQSVVQKKKKCGTILSGSDNCTESAKSQLWHWGMSSGKTEGNLRSNCLCLSFRLSFICTVPAEQSWQMGTCCAASVCSLSLWSGLCKAAERHSEFSILEFQSGGVGGVRTPVGAGSLETACFFKASSRFGATANLKWKWWVSVWLRVGSKASGGKVLQCVWALQPFSRGVSIRPGLQRWSWGVMWTAGSWNLLLVRVISNQVLLLLICSVVEESLAVQNKQCSHGVLHSK